MSKDELTDWDETAANNLDVGGISIAEGMNAANVNNALREIMAQVRAWQSGAAGNQFIGVKFDNLDSAYPTTEATVYFMRTTTGNPTGESGHVIIQSDPGLERDIIFVTGTTPNARVRINDAGIVMGEDGTAAAPSISWDGDDGFFHETDSIGMTIDGVRKAFIRASDGFFCTGKDDDGGIEDPGCVLGTDGNMVVTRQSAAPLSLNRLGDNGGIILLYEAGVLAGVISSAGGTVTYGSFCGAHWSQFNGQVRRDILRGTILETVNKMCEWPSEGIEQVLPMVRIAKARSPSLYGVFSHWDEDSRDMHVAALGANLIRIAPKTRVARGDLIVSDGNGCGVPQGDDIFRSCTVAKVIAAVPAETYEDGSYTVPCTLHCG